MRKKIISITLCIILTFTLPITAMAKSNLPSQESNEMQTDEVTPRLSFNYSTSPFYGTQASWYNVYKGTDKRSQKMDAVFSAITTSAMSAVISVIIGLSAVSLQTAASAIISAAISYGYGSSSNLYYTIAHYQNKNNPFQEKRIVKYYADNSYSKHLYTQTVYVEKVPLS